MGNFFDDFDAEDFAFWAGFIETQLEGLGKRYSSTCQRHRYKSAAVKLKI